MKTQTELPRPGSVPLPPLPHSIGADRAIRPASASLAPPPPPSTGRSPQASANRPQLGSSGFKKSNENAKRAGLIVGLLLVVMFVIGVGFILKALSGTTTINNVAVGDCLAEFFPEGDDGNFEVFLVKTAPCSEPHALEVFDSTDSAYFGRTEFPGVDEAFEIGQSFCVERFENFTGVPYDESQNELWSLVPIDLSWDQGDRRVQCIIGRYDRSTLVTGTLEGSGSGF